MIRKTCSDGVGYSVVDLTDVHHVFAAAVPRCGGSLETQADDALKTIEAVIREEGTLGSIVHQVVFLGDYSQLEEVRRIIRDFYGPEMPATTYVPQLPCEGGLISIEALGVGRKKGDVDILRFSDQLVLARHNNISWVHCANVVPQTSATATYDRAIDAFQRMRALLQRVDVRFDQIIRTWLYLGGIVDAEGESQRYKELNRARADFYEGIPFLHDRMPVRDGAAYPASTGIGADHRDVVMSCIALDTDRSDIIAMPLENPRQTPAFGYGCHYSPKSPKFSRAMALSCGSYATLFISGTASITDSETQHEGDVEGQTHETLDNIEALIDGPNLRRHHLPEMSSSLERLALARVYIKRKSDYPKVAAICKKRMGDVPTIYAVADVCRPDLLVEIEGVAFAQRGTPGCTDGHC